MDGFEKYMFNKITDFNKRVEENNGNEDVLFCLNTCLEEFVEILSEYNLNFKI